MYDQVVKIFNSIEDGKFANKVAIIAKTTNISYAKVNELLYRAGKRGDIYKVRQSNTFCRPEPLKKRGRIDNEYKRLIRVYHIMSTFGKTEDCSFEQICSHSKLSGEQIGLTLHELCEQGKLICRDGKFNIPSRR
jgi:hypothetical protein